MLVGTAPWQDQGGPDAVVLTRRIPAVVDLAFEDGYSGKADAEIVAWTPRAAWVVCSHPDPEVLGGLYKIWMPAASVQSAPGLARRMSGLLRRLLAQRSITPQS